MLLKKLKLCCFAGLLCLCFGSLLTASAPSTLLEFMDLEKPPPQPRPQYYIPEIPLRRELQRYTYYLCEERQIDYELALAVMWAESRFTVDAVHINTNGTQDSGVMQINDINSDWLAERLSVTDLMDAEQNILAGITILSDFVGKYGEQDGLMAYNLGETGMKRAKEQGIAITASAEKILKKRAEFEALPKSF